jgi:hypothetical protein
VNKERNKPKRKTWEQPWRYRESFLVVLELMFLGLIFEVLTGGRGAPLLKWPVNGVVGAGILLLLFIIYYRYKSRPMVKWLSSVPAAISAISFFALVTLLLGFIRQDDADANRYMSLLGLTHMKNSWLMMVSGMYFLTTLGLVALRRATPLRRKNLGFLLNHVGLWITIAAGYLGSGDLMRLDLTVWEGQPSTNQAMDKRTQQVHNLPFAVRLIDFNIEDYNPKLTIMDGRTGKLSLEEGKAMPFVEEGLKTALMDWDVEVLEYLPGAFRAGDIYVEADSMGNAPAAYVKAVNRASGEESKGWLSSGSFRVIQQHMPLDNHNFLIMTVPEPEKYSSDILIVNEKKEARPLTLEVNKPFKYRGWKLYQLSYDQRMGKWSRVSVIEAVRDPWLPLVYLGVFLLLAGALYLFWIGQDIKE